ncbi:MAG: hypothetical protein IT467_12445 [Dokdonella sp.]|nr:hypothetical protein [Dokdonella sp.]
MSIYPQFALARIGKTLDAFFAGVFWWRWKQWRAQNALEKSLKQHGDLSFETRQATERVREMDFAVRFWRKAPPAVRRVAQMAVKDGLPIEDVRLLVLNRDLLVQGQQVRLRRSLLLRATSVAAAGIVWFHWFLMMVLTFTQPVPWFLKVAAALGVTAVYAFLYRGWSLYLGRACRTVERCGSRMEMILKRDIRADESIRHINGRSAKPAGNPCE